jgi:hypothetical protein
MPCSCAHVPGDCRNSRVTPTECWPHDKDEGDRSHLPASVTTRNGFNEASLRELAATIREVGIIEPIIVRRHPTQDDRYIVIAGERPFKRSRTCNAST